MAILIADCRCATSANGPVSRKERGGGGNRTRVQGFAGPCLSHSATPPGEVSRWPSPRVYYRADDGIRTRDPHLGKVMLYQLSHVRAALAGGARITLADAEAWVEPPGSLANRTNVAPA